MAGAGPMLAQACGTLCRVIQSPTLAACQYTLTDCNTTCTGYMLDPTMPDPVDYLPMVRCLATLPPAGWECSSYPTDDGIMFGAIPSADGPCENEICAWTCGDATVVDLTAYLRCGC